MLYFAYGSNMDHGQMKERCPSARFFGAAKLPDHRLAFSRKSSARCCGVADAVPSEGDAVWGGVFEIEDGDLEELDRREGYRPGRGANSYWRREREVLLGGDENRPLAVWTYFAEREENPPRPSQAYKDQILAGARQCRLPEDHIRGLERIEVGG
ncbi:MAG: gamma-glutamylcyclotransferase [Planctomycetota bacterium]